MFFETRKRFALLNFHTRHQLLTRSDQAGHVEDYLNGHLTKISEKRLEGTNSTMLASTNHVNEVKRKEANTKTEVRNRTFFAKITINSFEGGSKNEMRTMIEAFLGMKSNVRSEKIHHLLKSYLVCFINKLIK